MVGAGMINIVYYYSMIFREISGMDPTMFWVMIYLIIDSVIITPAILYYVYVVRPRKKEKKEKRII